MEKSAIVVGAGIAGLAMARALVLKGYHVKVIEKNQKAVGASIRNFGMVWPVGQPEGELYEHAKRSAAIWKQICSDAKLYHDLSGSLHLAYSTDEEQVLEEVVEYYSKARPVRLLDPDQVTAISPAAIRNGLIRGMYSSDEVIVDPREVIAELPSYLHLKYGVQFIWNESVIAVVPGRVITASNTFDADLVVVCSGIELELLFPDMYHENAITKCKLQMMRFGEQPGQWRMGPALCGGLSLIHYHSFRVSKALNILKARYMKELPEYLEWGIHVMVSQNGRGELTVGDSHEYGATHDPFDRAAVNELILGYLNQFAKFPNEKIVESWNGVYAKMSGGEPYLFVSPMEGVYAFNGLGGAGMTLSFGLSEFLVKDF